MSHRAAIFELRGKVGPDGKPMSYGRIAAALGVSKSLVVKELHRPATLSIKDGAAGVGEPYTPRGTGPAGDPELEQANRSIALDRAELARIRLRADRLEQERRLRLFENPSAGGDTMMLLLDGQLQQLRADISRLGRAPAASPPPSLVDQLSQFRAVSETMQAFAPSPAPSSAAALELETIRQRLAMEDRERMRRLDIDERERLERAAGERARGEAVAKLIEGTGPLLAAAIQKWLDQPANSNGTATAAPAGERPALLPTPGGGTMLPPGTVAGPCPNCGAELRLHPEPGQVDRCPRCQLALAVVDGQIQPRVASERQRNYAS